MAHDSNHAEALHDLTERYHELLEQLESLLVNRPSEPVVIDQSVPSDHQQHSSSEMEILHLENHKLKLEIVRIKSMVKKLAVRIQTFSEKREGS